MITKALKTNLGINKGNLRYTKKLSKGSIIEIMFIQINI